MDEVCWIVTETYGYVGDPLEKVPVWSVTRKLGWQGNTIGCWTNKHAAEKIAFLLNDCKEWEAR